MQITYFITSHGFGHTTRAVEVINHIPKFVGLEICTAAPFWLLDKSIERPFAHSPLSHDCGIVQPDSFSQDIPATIHEWKRLLDAYPRMAKQEAERLKPSNPGLIVSDISPFGVAVARELGIPCVVIANFSWDWIFSVFTDRYPDFVPIINAISEWYSQVDLLLKTPLSDDLEVFPVRKSIPLIARKAKQCRNETRTALGLGYEDKVALVSFGGFGFHRLEADCFQRYPDWTFITMQESMLGADNVKFVDGQNCHHPDLVNAVDLVMAKLGYGLVSECMAHQKPIAHPPRADFPEHEILASEPRAYIPMTSLDESAFFSGDWPFLRDDLWRQPCSEDIPDCSGGETAAQLLVDMVR